MISACWLVYAEIDTIRRAYEETIQLVQNPVKAGQGVLIQIAGETIA